MENSQLLCTFTKKKYVTETVSTIQETYKSILKIFILQNIADAEELYCTYNADIDELKEKKFLKNTISIHRNKATNTLYSINAINTIILLLNDGNKDSSFKIDWEKYKNTLMVTNESGLNRINTKIYKIISS